MRHRERVLAALSHEEPDRVPIDLGSTRDSSILLQGHEQLKQHLGVSGSTVLLSRMMQVVAVDEQVLEALDIDTRGVHPGEPEAEILDEDRYRDEWASNGCSRQAHITTTRSTSRWQAASRAPTLPDIPGRTPMPLSGRAG